MPSDIKAESVRKKLAGYDFYREVLGSPKYIVAPMVDQSELAWRRLSRRYGAQLIYTPMINARTFSIPTNKAFRLSNFDHLSGEEGDPATDRPLVVQFCANDPEQLLASAKAVEKYCDAVDINLGCPQEIAKRGKYGAFLMDDWDLIYRMINILHLNLSIPVTAKFRVFPSIEKTVEYAKMLERAGAQIITCHGRLREQRGQNTGLASWKHIRAVKEAVSIPVFANGNILFQSDVAACLEATGADGVMSAEGQLYNPALFAGLNPSPSMQSHASECGDTSFDTTNTTSIPSINSDADILAKHPPHADLALEYINIVRTLKAKSAFTVSGIKGHLFKIMRPGLAKETDLRERLGRIRIDPRKGKIGENVSKDNGDDNQSTEKGSADVAVKKDNGPKGLEEGLREYEEVCMEMKRRMDSYAKTAAAEGLTIEMLTEVEPSTGLKVLPIWLAQPYFRPLPDQASSKAKDAQPSQLLKTKKEPAAGDLLERNLNVQQEAGCNKRVHSPGIPSEKEDDAKRTKLDVEFAKGQPPDGLQACAFKWKENPTRDHLPEDSALGPVGTTTTLSLHWDPFLLDE